MMNNNPNYSNYGPFLSPGGAWVPSGTANPSTTPLYPTPNTASNTYGPAITTMPMTIGLPGKVVGAPEEIAPQDVPMNGTVSFFPRSDYSEIYAKCWNSNGSIDTRVYILKPPENQQATTQPNDILSQILSRLDEIEKKITYKPKYNDNQRKEAKTNE